MHARSVMVLSRATELLASARLGSGTVQNHQRQVCIQSSARVQGDRAQEASKFEDGRTKQECGRARQVGFEDASCSNIQFKEHASATNLYELSAKLSLFVVNFIDKVLEFNCPLYKMLY